MKVFFTSLFLLCGFGSTIFAQVKWDFASASPTSGTLVNSTVSDVTRVNNNGTTTLLMNNANSTGYAGASGTNNITAAAVNGSLNTGTSTYFEVTITPATGFLISISSISFGSRSTGTGPALASIRSSLDGFTTNVASATLTTGSAWNLITPSMSLLTGATNTPITLRIYGSDGSGAVTNTAVWRLDDLSISYAVGVLAVNLGSFQGSLGSNNTATLKWTTYNEAGLLKYDLEKSTDAINYTTVASIIPAGNASYQYADANAGYSLNFYRLKMVNTDGTSRYSDIVRLNNTPGTSESLTLYPSPATTKINTSFFLKATQQLNLRIMDAAGKVYLQQTINAAAGSNSIGIPLSNLANGAYLVVLTGANGVSLVNRFIKN